MKDETQKRQLLRRQIKEKRNLLSDTEWREKSRQLLEQYFKLPFYSTADVILAYCNAKGEPDLSDLFRRSFQDGKPIAVPRVLTEISDGAGMEFVFLQPDSKTAENRFHIPEPTEGKTFLFKEWKGKQIELILPGLCFDRNGGRLGYGGGYYDRYLENIYQEIHKTALAFAFQVVENMLQGERLPIKKWDIPYDLLVTEQEVVRTPV